MTFPPLELYPLLPSFELSVYSRVNSISFAVTTKLSGFPELSESTSTVTAFYATGLAGPVGPTYKPPNLAFLARRWFESSSRPNAHMHIDLTLGAHLPLSGELRHSARLLFDAAVVRLSDEDTNAIVDEWQHQCENKMPCLVLHDIDLPYD